MTSPADDIPDLERLMRNVVRLGMQQWHGGEWVGTLSRSVRDGIEKSALRASTKRPSETLRDGWDAAGLSDIAALLRSSWPEFVVPIWPTVTVATVDLDRLIDYRDKNLHAVGPPTGQVGDQEIGAMIRRLRVGFEAVRRDLLDMTGDWWPYIAAAHSNIPEFCFERSSGGERLFQAVLTEGDLITIDAVGVHPTGDAALLRYVIVGMPTVGQVWQETGSFQMVVPPRCRLLGFRLVVAEGTDELVLGDTLLYSIRVRPRQD